MRNTRNEHRVSGRRMKTMKIKILINQKNKQQKVLLIDQTRRKEIDGRQTDKQTNKRIRDT